MAKTAVRQAASDGVETSRRGSGAQKPSGAAKTNGAQKPSGARRTNGAAKANGARSSQDDRALRQVEDALRKAAAGDFKVRLPARRDDAIGRVEAAYNELAARNAALEAELVRVGRIIGREGRMTERASLDGVEGGWRTTIGSVNGLIDDLVRPTTEVARVIVAVAEGDLSQKMALEIEGRPVKGEFARIGSIQTRTSCSWTS